VALVARASALFTHGEVSMDYAKIKDGLVVNVVLADAEFAAQQGLIPLASGAGIGFTYANGVYTAPIIPDPQT